MKPCALLVLLVLLAPASLWADEPAKGPSDKVKEKLGDEALGILKGATKVEAYRVNPDLSAKGDKRIGGYLITADGKEQGKEFAAKLAEVLYRDQSWFGQQARCYLPGVAFRISKDKEAIEVIICFTCENFRFIVKDAKGNEVKKLSGAFGPDLAPLVKLAKEAFPDDKDIQALKDKN